jgi:DNA-binding transcriptional LysR family regulator
MHDLRYQLASIRVFDVVCKAGGMRAAAQVLNVTPGAISQQIKRLETSLGVPLFRKAGREVELTEGGWELAARVGPLFGQIETAVDEFVQRRNSSAIRLKVTSAFASKWLLPNLASFCTAHPTIEVALEVVSRVDASESLGDAEVVVQQGDRWPGLQADLLFEDEFVPVCSPAMAASIHHVDDLLQTTVIQSMSRPEIWSIWLAAAGRAGATPTRSISLANSAICIQAAMDNVGVALGQLSFVEEDVARGRLVVPIGPVARTAGAYFLVCDPRRKDSYPVRDFREWTLGAAVAQRERVRQMAFRFDVPEPHIRPVV